MMADLLVMLVDRAQQEFHQDLSESIHRIQSSTHARHATAQGGVRSLYESETVRQLDSLLARLEQAHIVEMNRVRTQCLMDRQARLDQARRMVSDAGDAAVQQLRQQMEQDTASAESQIRALYDAAQVSV